MGALSSQGAPREMHHAARLLPNSINRTGQTIVQLLDNQAMQVVGDTPEQFAAFIEIDNARMSKLVKDANIKAE